MHAHWIPAPEVLTPWLHGCLHLSHRSTSPLEPLFPTSFPAFGASVLVVSLSEKPLVIEEMPPNCSHPFAFLVGPTFSNSCIHSDTHWDVLLWWFRPTGWFHMWQDTPTSFSPLPSPLLKTLTQWRTERESPSFASCLEHVAKTMAHQTSYMPSSSHVADRFLATLQEIGLGHSISHYARAVGASERTLRRKVKQAIGLTPKQFLRTRRIYQVMALKRANPALDALDLAVLTGFHDTAHLAHEAKACSGYTLSELIGDPMPHADLLSAITELPISSLPPAPLVASSR